MLFVLGALCFFFFFFNDTATTEIYTLSLHDALPISSRLTFAARVVAQGVDGNAPFHELATVQSSFKPQDGLGGSSTIRGLPKDRYVGKGLLITNSELRWRAAEFNMLGRSSFLAFNGFADAGRVWEKAFDIGTALDDLHVGYGVGARLGLGPSFIIAADVG